LRTQAGRRIEVVLVAEEDHLVLQQRVVDRRGSLGIKVARQPDAVYPGADVRAQFHHIEVIGHARIVRQASVGEHGLNGRDSKADVTATTPRPLVIRPTQDDEYPPLGQYVLPNCTRVQQRVGKGTTMFALIALGVLLLVLIAGLGLPYPQTWHGRWGSDG
jgi:hypothetical protein